MPDGIVQKLQGFAVNVLPRVTFTPWSNLSHRLLEIFSFSMYLGPQTIHIDSHLPGSVFHSQQRVPKYVKKCEECERKANEPDDYGCFRNGR